MDTGLSLPKRQKSITGKYISNAIGFCHCETHPGALDRENAYKHKCMGKRCKWLEKYNKEAFEKKEYKNNRRKAMKRR